MSAASSTSRAHGTYAVLIRARDFGGRLGEPLLSDE